ncbi:MAG TPA: hypothetical protein VKW04_21575 [Planctomycetota bacterium]|nr:hypothetical protein [Planctomycetota bacterium]
MNYILLLLPLLALPASAQDDVWKTLSKGDRVQVTFRSGNMIQGQVTGRPSDPRIPDSVVDYSQATEITLDVSLEYPGLNGTISIPRSEVKEIRKLQNLDSATMKRIQDEVARIKQQAAADDSARRTAELDRDKAAKKAREDAEKLDKNAADLKNKGAAAVKDLEDLQKGLDLLKKFPPGQFGPDTAKIVADKALRKQPVTQAETEFLDQEVQRLWFKALDYQKQQEALNSGK